MAKGSKFYRALRGPFCKAPLLAATATVLHATAAQAQVQPKPSALPAPSTQVSASDGRAAEPSTADIVITGQKRVGTTLDVPVTVNVVSAETMRTNQVYDLQGLARIVPGFNFERAAGMNLTASLRGIGTAPGATSLEQSIAPYIDGVYQAGTQRGFGWPVFDLERVEVFKGTQAGSVGQNTSVGVINMVTSKPGPDFGGYLDASREFENKGYALTGAVDVPVTDSLHLRFSGIQQHTGGWARNFATGKDISDQYLTGGRLNAVWEATSKLKVSLYAEYDRIKANGPIVSQVFDDPTGGYATAIRPFFTFDPSKSQVAYIDRRGRAPGGDDLTKADNWRGSLTVDWDLGGGYSLASITAASRENDFLQVDQDYTPAPQATTPTSQASQALDQSYRYNQVTQELRLASPTTDRLSYILGAWYRHAKTDRHFDFYLNRFGGNFEADVFYDQKIDNGAVFGDVQFKLTSMLSLGGSLRYTKETKTSVSSVVSNWPVIFFPLAPTRISLKPSFFDGSARIEFKPSDSFKLYGGYSHGTKTGTVPDIVGSGILQILRPEKAETYEIGAKGSLFDRAVTFEVSVFRMNITDFQDVSTQVANGLTIFAASNSDIRTNGVDFNVRARPFAGFEFGVNGEYLDAYNETFGGPHVRSPKWALLSDARYTFAPEVAGGKVALFGSVQYKADYFTQPANLKTVFGPQAIPIPIATKSPAFTKLNIGIEYIMRNGFKATLVCRNCTNEFEYTRVIAASMFGAPVRYGYLNELRTITLGLRYDF